MRDKLYNAFTHFQRAGSRHRLLRRRAGARTAYLWSATRTRVMKRTSVFESTPTRRQDHNRSPVSGGRFLSSGSSLCPFASPGPREKGCVPCRGRRSMLNSVTPEECRSFWLPGKAKTSAGTRNAPEASQRWSPEAPGICIDPPGRSVEDTTPQKLSIMSGRPRPRFPVACCRYTYPAHLSAQAAGRQNTPVLYMITTIAIPLIHLEAGLFQIACGRACPSCVLCLAPPRVVSRWAMASRL
jgi:hypothetical protein